MVEAMEVDVATGHKAGSPARREGSLLGDPSLAAASGTWATGRPWAVDRQQEALVDVAAHHNGVVERGQHAG